MTQDDVLILAASAAVVLVMVGFAAVLGFRQSACIDDGELARLAANEGARVESMVLDANGKSALALLVGGKLLVARVMADGVSARVTQAVKLRLAGGRLRMSFSDLGFAPLSLKLSGEPPEWLRAIVARENT